MAEINETIDRWASSAIDDQTRRHSLALELARLGCCKRHYSTRALEVDVECDALVTKIIER